MDVTRTPESLDELPHLLGEHARVAQSIESLAEQATLILGLGFSAIGGALVTGLEADLPALVVFTPFGLLLVILYHLNVLIEILGRGGYARALEVRINSLASVPLRSWEDIARTIIHGRLPWTAWILGIAAFVIVSMALALQSAAAAYGTRVGWVVGVGLLAFGALAIVCGMHTRKAWDDAFKHAMAIASASNPPVR